VESCKDPIGLLKIIQGLCCSYDSKTQSVMATVASQKKLITFFQRDGVDNSTYHREFMAHVDTIKTYGGMGAIPFLVSSSRNINLTTIEHAPQRTASKLGYLLT